MTGTNIPAPVVTGGEPGQVYFRADREGQPVSVAGSGGMFGRFIGIRLAPFPDSLRLLRGLLVSVIACGRFTDRAGRPTQIPGTCPHL